MNGVARDVYKYVIFIMLLGWSTLLFAAPQILHIPVNTAFQGQNIPIDAKVEGTSSRVIFLRVYFKQPEQETFLYEELVPEIDKWTGVIPKKYVTGSRLQYFISALLEDQSIVSFPAHNPYNNPEEIVLTPKPEGPGPQVPKPRSVKTSPFLILSPESEEQIEGRNLLFAASFNSPEKIIDSSTVRLYLDGFNVTKDAEISAYMATYESGRLDPGRHWVRITARTRNGIDVPAEIVYFDVAGAPAAEPSSASRFRAHIFADMRQETVAQGDQSPAMSGGDFDGQYGSVFFNGRFFLTSLEDRAYQPRNRFFFSVHTDKVGISGGDVYPRYNDLIFWGKRVRGVSAYLRLGFFNVETVFGETYRPVEGNGSMVPVLDDSTGAPLKTITGTDSTRLNLTRYGTFAQQLFAVRPSFGSGRRFQMGFSFVKVRDDKNSITYGTMPKDNLVLGPDLKLVFDQGRVVFKTTAAFSMITNNIKPGTLTSDDLNEIFQGSIDVPIDPADLENYLIINDSTIPLDPTKLTSMAYDAQVKLSYYNNLLRLGYKSIGGEFYSLANSWVRTGIRGFYFSDRLRLYRNKIYLTLGYENFMDNFSEQNANPRVNLQNFNYSVSYYPGEGLPYLNIGLQNHLRKNNVNAKKEYITDLDVAGQDTTIIDNRENQVYRDLNMQMGYDFFLFDLNNSFQISYITGRRNDRYSDSRKAEMYSQDFNTDIRMVSLTTNYQFPLQTTINYAGNANKSGGGQSDYSYGLFTVGAEYKLLDDKLAFFGEMRVTDVTGNTVLGENIDYSRKHFRLGGRYRFGDRHSVLLDTNVITYDGGNTNGLENDTILRLRYEKFF